MKSVLFVASLLASLAVAQPHGHGSGHAHHHRRKQHGQHPKRGLVVEWVTETVIETVTAIVDDSTTELIMPSTKAATTTPLPSPAPSPSPSPSPKPHIFIENQDSSSSTSTSTSKAAAPPPRPPPPPPPPPPPAPTPTSSAKPVETPGGSSGGGAGNGGGAKGPTYTGDITYFALGLGACGFDDSGKDLTDNIVAVSAQLMGAQSNGNPFCNKSITIKANGKTLTAVVRDKCPSCAPGDIDGTEKMFNELFGSLEAGRQKIEWWFNV